MVRVRFDLKIKRIFRENNVPLLSNRKYADPTSGVVVTQYNNNKVVIVLNGFLTVEECYILLDGILKEVEVIIYK